MLWNFPGASFDFSCLQICHAAANRSLKWHLVRGPRHAQITWTRNMLCTVVLLPDYWSCDPAESKKCPQQWQCVLSERVTCELSVSWSKCFNLQVSHISDQSVLLHKQIMLTGCVVVYHFNTHIILLTCKEWVQSSDQAWWYHPIYFSTQS